MTSLMAFRERVVGLVLLGGALAVSGAHPTTRARPLGARRSELLSRTGSRAQRARACAPRCRARSRLPVLRGSLRAHSRSEACTRGGDLCAWGARPHSARCRPPPLQC
jgi:hypothetical protein